MEEKKEELEAKKRSRCARISKPCTDVGFLVWGNSFNLLADLSKKARLSREGATLSMIPCSPAPLRKFRMSFSLWYNKKVCIELGGKGVGAQLDGLTSACFQDEGWRYTFERVKMK